MDDDSNTQEKAWAKLGEKSTVALPEEKRNSPIKDSFWDDALKSIDLLLAEEEETEKETDQPQKTTPGNSLFGDSIDALQALLGEKPEVQESNVAELMAGLDPVFQNTGEKSIGDTEGLEGYNAIHDLNLLIRDGWKLCFHTLLSVNSANSLKYMTGIKLGGNFNHRLALPMAPEQGSAFLYYTKVLKNMADEGDQISAVYEYMGGNGQRFIPYL